MQNPYYDREPDPLEKKIRFGCGFFFGLVLGGLEFVRMAYKSAGVIVASTLIAALLCGLLALKYGDRFWNWMIERWRWWT
jgi:hypothetical protein